MWLHHIIRAVALQLARTIVLHPTAGKQALSDPCDENR